MTPDEALEMYHGLVEQNDQAVPILLMEVEGERYAIAIEIPEGHSGAEMIARFGHHIADAPRPSWAMFSCETWVRPIDPKTGEELGMNEAVIVTYVDQSQGWTSLQEFVRTRDGVRWGEVKHLPTEGLGGEARALVPALTAIVRAA